MASRTALKIRFLSGSLLSKKNYSNLAVLYRSQDIHFTSFKSLLLFQLQNKKIISKKFERNIFFISQNFPSVCYIPCYVFVAILTLLQSKCSISWMFTARPLFKK